MALKACPVGFHLPSSTEWTELVNYVGKYSAATKLKSTSGWKNNTDPYAKNGTDNYGFSALPGGHGYSDGTFGGIGGTGWWWGATENHWYIDASSEDVVKRRDFTSGQASVRCVQD
jgi:uncharacterized protein (TIGR02145 family)